VLIHHLQIKLSNKVKHTKFGSNCPSSSRIKAGFPGTPGSPRSPLKPTPTGPGNPLGPRAPGRP